VRFGIADITPTTCGDRSGFPAQSSVLDEQAIFHRVVPLYDLPAPRSCAFLTRGDSDIYRIETATGPYYLKIRRPPVDAAICEAEAQLVAALADAGLPVVRPVVLKSGGHATEICASEGRRGILVFEAAPPSLRGALDAHLARQFGQTMGRMHEVSDQYSGCCALPDADLTDLHTAADDVAAAVALSDTQQAWLHQAARYVSERYTELSCSDSDYGPIHGDLAPCNVCITAEGRLTLFDFGAAHRDWRLNELLNVWHRTMPRETPEMRLQCWQAFLDGYATVRQVPRSLERFKGVTHLSGKLRMMGYVCNALTLRRGIEPIEESRIVGQVAEIEQLLQDLANGHL